MFSIIIATKNEEHYIGRTLRLLRKILKGLTYEIIIVDSSTDKTFKIAVKLADKTYRFLGGVSKARNFGAKVAYGDILVFMDADSIPSKEVFLETQRILKKNIVAAVSYVLPYTHVGVLGRIFYTLDSAYIKLSGKLPPLLKLYNRGDFIAVKKEYFFKVGGFPESFHVAEITDLINRLLHLGRVAVLKSPVYESARRFKKWGFIKNHLVWLPHYVSYFLRQKPINIKYEEVR